MPYQYEDKTYETFADFCRDHELRYPTAVAQLHKGMSLEEIVKQQKVVRYKARKKVVVEYDGQTYPSLSAAGNALGIAPSILYSCKKRHNLSPSETIAYVMERKNKYCISGHHKPCTVNGVTYESQAAAARAHGIPMVTITARMQREGISFEEAIERRSKERRQFRARKAIFNPDKLILISEEYESAYISRATVSQLLEKFQSYQYKPTLYLLKDTDCIVIKIQESFGKGSTVQDVYMLFAKSNINFVAPRVYMFSSQSDEILGKINHLNNLYVGIKLVLNEADSSITALSDQCYLQSYLVTSSVLNALFAFMGAIEDTLKSFEQ